ncbi:MAG TPA: hypothetical protein VFX35_09880 [Solirubrobacterales bacterium]|nr:hypothetical protein [Solirubrobacterales bacterium]
MEDLGRLRTELRAQSRVVFGRKHRLEVGALIGALAPPIWPRNIARLIDIGENQASSELAVFEMLGALQRFPSGFDRRKIYQKTPHPLWPLTRQMLEGTIYRLSSEGYDLSIESYWEQVLQGAVPETLLD